MYRTKTQYNSKIFSFCLTYTTGIGLCMFSKLYLYGMYFDFKTAIALTYIQTLISLLQLQAAMHQNANG